MNLAIHVAGWSLVHFVWQGLAVAIVAATLLRLLRAAIPQARYAVACAALVAMVAAPLVTACLLMADATNEPRVARTLLSADSLSAGLTITNAAPAADDAANAVRRGISTFLPLIVTCWIGGVTLLFIRLCGGWLRLRRVQRTSLQRLASEWQPACDRIAILLGTPLVHVVDALAVDTPTLIGYWRPVILLPIAALANLTPAQVDAILAHELAHVRRHDYLLNVLQNLAETLLFYHPAVWWVSRRIRTEREQCCDDVAVKACGDATGYAAALAELEQWRTHRATLALAATQGRLVDRIRRMLEGRRDSRPSTSALVTAASILLAVVASALPHVPALAMSGPPAVSVQERVQSQLVPRRETVHFDLFAPPGLALENLERAAEAAYDRVSAELRHDLAFKVDVIAYTTRDDLDRALASNVPQGRPGREHILLPLDTPPSRLQSDLVHEVSHVFFFDIVPGGGNGGAPRWVLEGLADYLRGEWDSGDLELLAERLDANAVPRMSTLRDATVAGNPRIVYALGHAAFDLMELRWDKDGVRQFLMAVRQNARGSSADPFSAALGVSPEEFDRSFVTYVRDVVARSR